MNGNVADLLTDPDSFFEQRARDASLLYPALLVTLIAVVGIITVVVTLRQFTGVVDESVRMILFTFMIVGAITSLVGPYVSWLLYAGLAHGTSAIFDGEGDFSTTLSLIGWSFLPRVLGVLVSLAVTLYVVTTVQPPTDVASFQAYNQQIQSTSVQLVGRFGVILFKVWSIALMVFAVEHARNIEREHAVVAVAVPAVIDLGIVAIGLLSTLLF